LASKLVLAGADVSVINGLPTYAVNQEAVVVSREIPAVDVNLLNTGTTPYFDMRGASEAVIQIQTDAAFSGGSFVFETTSDGDTNSVPPGILVGYDEAAAGITNSKVALNFTSSDNRLFRIPLSSRYVRLRTVTSPTAGIITARTSSKSGASTPISNVGLSLSGIAVDQSNPLPTTQSIRPLINAIARSSLNADLLSGVTGGWFDTQGATELLFQIVVSTGVTSGGFTYEGSNDPTISTTPGALMPFDEPAIAGSVNIRTAVSAAANSRRVFRAAISTRYVRLRLSTAVAGGTYKVIAYLRDNPFVASPREGQAVSISGAVAVNATPVSVAGTVLDSLTTRTTSGTGVPGTNVSGRGILIYTNITTAPSGTSPTLVLSVQVQDPVSLTWVNLPGATLPVRTAAGVYTTVIYPGAVAGPEVINMPVPRVYRLAWTIGGTTPSFTFSTAVAQLL
jgi:hypothetical protein